MTQNLRRSPGPRNTRSKNNNNVSGRVVLSLPSGALEYMELSEGSQCHRYVHDAAGHLVRNNTGKKNTIATTRSNANRVLANRVLANKIDVEGEKLFENIVEEMIVLQQNVASPQKQAGLWRLTSWIGQVAKASKQRLRTAFADRRFVIFLLIAAFVPFIAAHANPGVRAVLRAVVIKTVPKDPMGKAYAKLSSGILSSGGWVAGWAIKFWKTVYSKFSVETVTSLYTSLVSAFNTATATASAKMKAAERIYQEGLLESAASDLAKARATLEKSGYTVVKNLAA